MKAMLNNAIKGDYIAAETDPSVSLYKKEMCCSRKYSYWTHEWLLEIPVGGRGGGLKAKFFREKYKPNWNF